MRHEDDEINPFSREYTSQQDNSIGKPAPQSPAPPQRGGSNFLVWLIPLLLAMVFVPMICCGGLLFFGVRQVAQEVSEPLDAAVAAIEEDNRISAELGTPVERTSSYGVQNFNYDNGDGSATVDFDVKGPDGSANVKGKMKLFAGEWSPEDLTITLRDGTEFKLPATVEIPAGGSF